MWDLSSLPACLISCYLQHLFLYFSFLLILQSSSWKDNNRLQFVTWPWRTARMAFRWYTGQHGIKKPFKWRWSKALEWRNQQESDNNWCKLFSYAESTDYVLMVLGAIGALGNGWDCPSWLYILGNLLILLAKVNKIFNSLFNVNCTNPWLVFSLNHTDNSQSRFLSIIYVYFNSTTTYKTKGCVLCHFQCLDIILSNYLMGAI